MAPRPLGHLREIESLKWLVRVLRGYENGDSAKPRYKQKTVYGTRADAERVLADMLVEYGRPGSLSDVTVGQALRQWAEAHEVVWTRNQCATARSITKKLTPLAHVRADSLTPKEVERFRDRLLGAGLAPSYVQRILGSLSTCFRWLKRQEVVAANPVEGVRVPTDGSRIRPPTEAAVRSFLAAIKDEYPREYAAFRLAAVTGARRSEIVGLQWGDIADGKIAFQRTVAADNARTVRPALKAGHSKVLGVDAETLAAIEAARRDDVWVFGDDGRPWRPDRLTNAFARLQRRFDVGLSCRLHDLRHYQASVLIDRGATIVEVAHRLGHKKPSTTLDTYSHLVKPDEKIANLAAEGL